jgi:integrase
LPESLGALRDKVITIHTADEKIMRSTFKILFYINKSKTKTDGTTAILCRIIIDGANVVITTGESVVPHDWSVKRGETTEKKTNQRLQTFREEIEQGYNTLLYKYGAVSAELLKNYLQGIGRTPTTLLALSVEELKAQRENKSEGTYSNNLCSDRQLNAFVRSRGEEDISITALAIDFFDNYRFYLKKEGYALATINRHLCWLSRLMYRAVSQGTIRFNPFEEVKYEAVECKPRFLSKGDVAKLLAFPLQDEGAELSRRMFLFSVFTGLAFADLQSLRASQIETNSEGKRYIRKARQKTEVECLIPLHPIAEQILALYTKEKSRGDYKIFPDTMSKGKLLTHLKAVGLACGIRTPLTYHVGRHRFGTMTLEAGIPMESIARMMGHSSIASTQIYAQITDQKIARDMDMLIQ